MRCSSLVLVLAILVWAPAATGAVHSSYTAQPNAPQGTLRIESDGSDSILVGCIGGRVLINGAAPDSGPLECFRASRIDVIGGPGDNRIDLGGISPAQAQGVFKGVAAHALVDGRAGNDVIIGPSGGLVEIVGGVGSDWLQGGAYDTYVFAAAAAREQDTIVEPVRLECSPSYFETNQGGLSYWTVPWDALDFRSLGADDPLTLDALAPDGVLATHRNRTILLAGSSVGTRFEAVAGGVGGDTISGGCMVLGGAGDDVLEGTRDGDLLVGGDGNDRLGGREGPDVLDGGPGRDRLDGGPDPDALAGGRGSDVHYGRTGGDTYLFASADGKQSDLVGEEAGSGVDVLSFDLDVDWPLVADLTQPEVVARARDLEVRVEAGTARFFEGLIGGKGNDRLTGSEGRNHFWGGGGIDLAVGGAGNDVYHVDWAGSMPYAAYAWGEVWSGPFERNLEPGRSVWTVRETRQSVLRILERPRGGVDTVDLAEAFYSGRLEGQLEGARIDLSAPLWIVNRARVKASSASQFGARHLEAIRGTVGPDVLVGNAADNRLEGREGRDRVLGRGGNDLCVIRRRDGDVVHGCERIRRSGR